MPSLTFRSSHGNSSNVKNHDFFVLVMLNSRQSDKKAKCFALSFVIGQAVFTALMSSARNYYKAKPHQSPFTAGVFKSTAEWNSRGCSFSRCNACTTCNQDIFRKGNRKTKKCTPLFPFFSRCSERKIHRFFTLLLNFLASSLFCHFFASNKSYHSKQAKVPMSNFQEKH